MITYKQTLFSSSEKSNDNNKTIKKKCGRERISEKARGREKSVWKLYVTQNYCLLAESINKNLLRTKTEQIINQSFVHGKTVNTIS